MMSARLATGFALIALAGCAIPPGEPIGASRLAIGPGPTGKTALVVPSCPDWHRDSREDFSNRNASNFGCADAVNFLGQLADPADALHGRATGRQDGAVAADGVERYRLHKTTPLATGGSGPAAGAPPTGDPS